MGITRKETPEFFEESPFDPVKVATGKIDGDGGEKSRRGLKGHGGHTGPGHQKQILKKKAGFYLSIDLLERFTRKFHELKLSGVLIENKSALIEAAISFALDDMDAGDESIVLKRLQS